MVVFRLQFIFDRSIRYTAHHLRLVAECRRAAVQCNMFDHAAVFADHAVALIRLCNGCDNRFVRQHELVDGIILRAERLFSRQRPFFTKFRYLRKCLRRVQLHQFHRILCPGSGRILIIDDGILKLQITHQLKRHSLIRIIVTDICKMAHRSNACFPIFHRCEKGIFRIRYDR